MNIIKLKTLSRVMTIAFVVMSIGGIFMLKSYNNGLNFRIINKEKIIDEKDLKVYSYTVLVDRLKTEEEILQIGEDIYYKLATKYTDIKAFELKFVNSYSKANGPYLKLVYAPGGDINNCYGLVQKESTFRLIRIN